MKWKLIKKHSLKWKQFKSGEPIRESERKREEPDDIMDIPPWMRTNRR